MNRKKLFPNKASINRVNAGSESGIAGRQYPIQLAEHLNKNSTFVEHICKCLKRKSSDFLRAEAGKELPSRVLGILSDKAILKTSLRIIWKDGSKSNFRVTTTSDSQIHLESALHFIKEFEAQFKVTIPFDVKEALLLFCGQHPKQDEILSAIPVDYVGKKIRQKVEINYFSRLTLASMYGYNEKYPLLLLDWFRKNLAELFMFCFSYGAVKNREEAPDYILYRTDKEDLSSFEIYDLHFLYKQLTQMVKDKTVLQKEIRPNDVQQIGSTIAFPFGNLQQHENRLQFRHRRKKLKEIMAYEPIKAKKFGALPKLSGHKNEELIADSLNKNLLFRTHFCEKIGIDVAEFVAATAGGQHAKLEDSVIAGKKTAGKTDIVVMWKGGVFTNISIKKRASGQVYLVSAKNFVAAYEAQYQTKVPEKVQRALQLFIGEAADSKALLDATDISIDGPKVRSLAYEQNYRLMFEVISAYDPDMANKLLTWLKEKIVTVCEICFSAGAVKDKDKWAHILWYKNLVDAEGQGLDYLISIKQIMEALELNKENNRIERGPCSAGSTIQLPFGHLQYHQRKLEFYQQLKKIQKLLTILAE